MVRICAKKREAGTAQSQRQDSYCDQQHVRRRCSCDRRSRRTEALEIFNRQLQVLQLELAAVEVDRAARLETQQPERHRHLDDALVVGVEGKNVELIRTACVVVTRAIGIGAKKMAALVELYEWCLTGELSLDTFELHRRACRGRDLGVEVLRKK